MKTSKHTAPTVLPVSRKAYAEFVDRICHVFASDASMIKTLDRYLGGERSVGETLDDAMRMIFEFLRYDVDKAVERSRRARERARNRRQPRGRMDREDLESLVNEHLNRIFTIVENEDADSREEANTFRRPLTRRERRARERSERGKSRIKPLNSRV